ncbi:hypothetical protein [Amycolatopsis sp. EV170708-02-1]|uniref:hypothetical protein n=1 Tax=Amycolatopsis sp. EV170708-02-1 TaxID=2919322 RepID=UPI001F0BCBC3|nr:hypothetical protein [Amycolatopsis sp. EV170708-02-1]UMP06956.1 hypothetical protein MJQ72_20020 [Amycolatopsis sp. EV170708-02-1]
MSMEFDPAAIRLSAGKLGDIMNDMSAFTALKVTVPNAGSFEVAKWLEQIVQDRVNGIVAHAEHLQIALRNMDTTLTQIANEFENADGENAKRIKASIAELQSTIRQDISSFDANSSSSEDSPVEKSEESLTERSEVSSADEVRKDPEDVAPPVEENDEEEVSEYSDYLDKAR